jgi:hypothetical protein
MPGFSRYNRVREATYLMKLRICAGAVGDPGDTR